MARSAVSALLLYVTLRAVPLVIFPACIPVILLLGSKAAALFAALLYVAVGVFVYWLCTSYRDWSTNIDGVPLKEAISHTFGQVHLGALQSDEPTLDVSLIVPAYNEEERLPVMLSETVAYLKSRPKTTFEIVVVDDGSSDGTFEVVKEFGSKVEASNIKVRGIQLRRNRGKGFAVRTGMLCGQGKSLLMVDADAATEIADLKKLESSMQSGSACVFGSRAHLQDEATATRSFSRNILMYGFHAFIELFIRTDIKDTQCGFKLFNRKAAREIFSNLHLSRWSFDVEMVFIASTLRHSISEVAVNWQEIPGSKLDVIEASITMARDIMGMCLCYDSGLWICHYKVD